MLTVQCDIKQLNIDAYYIFKMRLSERFDDLRKLIIDDIHTRFCIPYSINIQFQILIMNLLSNRCGKELTSELDDVSIQELTMNYIISYNLHIDIRFLNTILEYIIDYETKLLVKERFHDNHVSIWISINNSTVRGPLQYIGYLYVASTEIVTLQDVVDTALKRAHIKNLTITQVSLAGQILELYMKINELFELFAINNDTIYKREIIITVGYLGG